MIERLSFASGLVVPRKAIPFILLQRPMLQRFQVPARRIGIPFSIRTAAESIVRRRAIARAFAQMMAADFKSLRPYLRSGIRDVIDVGCGLAAIDALLFQHFECNPDMHFLLVDRTELRAEPKYGFAARDEYYNSLPVARALLTANGVPSESIELLEVTQGASRAFPPADLVVSLASWGFHYPVSTYLEQVSQALRPDGLLILDLRSGTGEESLLEQRFGRIERVGKIFEGEAVRYCVCRSGQPGGRLPEIRAAHSSRH